jgi:hypothetical protein
MFNKKALSNSAFGRELTQVPFRATRPIAMAVVEAVLTAVLFGIILQADAATTPMGEVNSDRAGVTRAARQADAFATAPPSTAGSARGPL